MNATTTPTIHSNITNPDLKPGSIWTALYPRNERGVRGGCRQDLLILSHPQELPNGQTAVIAVAVLYETEDLMHTDLYAVDLERRDGYRVGRPVVFEFHTLRSVLVSDLHRYRWSLEECWKPLLKAYWKAMVGLQDFPCKEEFPGLSWETGVPITVDEEGFVQPASCAHRFDGDRPMRWLASRFHDALHAGEE